MKFFFLRLLIIIMNLSYDFARNTFVMPVLVLSVVTWICSISLKVVSATFLLVRFVCLKESTCETRKNGVFSLRKLSVLEIFKF